MTLPTPHIVDIKRNVEGKISGYVISHNSQLIVVLEFDGFVPAGLVAMPSSTVVDLAINEAWTRMIAAEGYAELAHAPPSFDTDDLRSALVSVHRRNINVKIECENCPDAEEYGFHIGRIIALGESSLEFVFFDSTGVWFDSSYPIPYTSITQLVVDAPYVTKFSKYLGPCPVETINGG